MCREPVDHVVLYYADWCPYCVKMKPYWAHAKLFAEKNNASFDMSEHNVDVPHTEELVRGIPTIVIYYKNGTKSRYNYTLKSKADAESFIWSIM